MRRLNTLLMLSRCLAPASPLRLSRLPSAATRFGAPRLLSDATSSPEETFDLVDMRSDTVTTPCPAMREVMASATVGDDVFGDDPTVHALQDKVADLFGKEAGLFVPSGTQGNLIMTMVHTWERGSEFIVGDKAHIYIYEQGGAATIGGAHPRALTTDADGTLPLESIRGAIRGDDPHYPVTKMVALENTHNLAGGRVLSNEYVCAKARDIEASGAVKPQPPL